MYDYEVSQKRLNDVYPNAGFTRNGFFSYLFQSVPLSWIPDANRALELDRAFHGLYGKRLISPYLEGYGDTVTDADKQQIALDVYRPYAENWERLYALLSVEYNPIENYRMTETENQTGSASGSTGHSLTSGGTHNVQHSASGTITDTETNTGTRELNRTYTGTETETLTKSGTETHITDYAGTKSTVLVKAGAERTIDGYQSAKTQQTTESGTETENRDVYGFNSDTEQPANKTTRGFDGRVTSITETIPERQTQTAFQDRSDTTTESFTNRADTATDSFTNRTDTSSKEYNNRADRETETFTNRQRVMVMDDSAHVTHDNTTLSNTETLQGTDSKQETVNRTMTRSGNIGVTTSQQMAQSEIKLWNEWNFYRNSVFPAVAYVLTIGAY